MDLSVVIRGPLYDCSLDNIQKYINELSCKIVISHWEDGTNKGLKTLVWNNGWKYEAYEPEIPKSCRQKLTTLLDGYSKLITEIENKYSNIRGVCNFEKLKNIERNVYQFYSTLKGLEICNTDFSICIRSDIPYPNLKPIKERLKKFPEKIITSNTNFRPDRLWKYHMGSHIVAGKTKLLMDMYNICFNICDNKCMDGYIQKILKIHPPNKILVGEQLMTYSVMILQGEEFTTNNSKELMKKYFDVVPINKLGGQYRSNEAKAFQKKGIINTIDDL